MKDLTLSTSVQHSQHHLSNRPERSLPKISVIKYVRPIIALSILAICIKVGGIGAGLASFSILVLLYKAYTIIHEIISMDVDYSSSNKAYNEMNHDLWR